MKRPCTDRKLLRTIYDTYYDEFISYEQNESTRSSKNYVPIDIDAVGKDLNIDADIVFGQLYYHLERKHGYTDAQGATVHLFAMRVGRDHHVIHFPMLSAVLAELEQNNYRFLLPIVISSLALLFSLVGMFGLFK